MTSKSTFTDIEQRVESLAKELALNKSKNNSDRLNLQYLKAFLNNTNMPIFLKDADFKYIFMNPQLGRFAHVDHSLVNGKDDFVIFSKEIAQLFRSQDEEVVRRKILVEFEETIDLPGGVQTFMTAKFPLIDSEGKVYAVGGVCTDITPRKLAEEELQKAHAELEQRVLERTAQISRQSERLMETNVALNVLLEKRQEDKKELEEKMIFNFEKLIYPYLEKLKTESNQDSRESIIAIIRSNLDETTSSFAHKRKDYFSKLTPAQIQIADMIKQGKTTKEIASFLNLSPLTIARHRQEIRKRLSLANKKINLQAALTVNT